MRQAEYSGRRCWSLTALYVLPGTGDAAVPPAPGPGCSRRGGFRWSGRGFTSFEAGSSYPGRMDLRPPRSARRGGGGGRCSSRRSPRLLAGRLSPGAAVAVFLVLGARRGLTGVGGACPGGPARAGANRTGVRELPRAVGAAALPAGRGLRCAVSKFGGGRAFGRPRRESSRWALPGRDPAERGGEPMTRGLAIVLLPGVHRSGRSAEGQVLIRVGDPARATYPELHEGLRLGTPAADSARVLHERGRPCSGADPRGTRRDAPWNEPRLHSPVWPSCGIAPMPTARREMTDKDRGRQSGGAARAGPRRPARAAPRRPARAGARRPRRCAGAEGSPRAGSQPALRRGRCLGAGPPGTCGFGLAEDSVPRRGGSRAQSAGI